MGKERKEKGKKGNEKRKESLTPLLMQGEITHSNIFKQRNKNK